MPERGPSAAAAGYLISEPGMTEVEYIDALRAAARAGDRKAAAFLELFDRGAIKAPDLHTAPVTPLP